MKIGNHGVGICDHRVGTRNRHAGIRNRQVGVDCQLGLIGLLNVRMPNKINERTLKT